MSAGLDTDYLRRCEDREEIDQLRATIARQAAEIARLRTVAIPEEVLRVLRIALNDISPRHIRHDEDFARYKRTLAWVDMLPVEKGCPDGK